MSDNQNLCETYLSVAGAGSRSPSVQVADMNLQQSIELAEREAASGCGQSDVLYEKRVQDSYRAILERAAPEARESTEAALRKRGFDPQFVPYEAGEGECDLTGIETWCCPCGRHE